MLARIEVRKFRTLMAIAGLALVLSMILGFSVPAAARENRNHDRHHATLFATGQAATGPLRVLLAIDVERGTTAVIGPATGSLAPGSLALAITPDGRTAYTIANAFNPASAQLATINLTTGVQALVGRPIGVDLKIMGMTFSPDGVLYAAGDFETISSTFNSLYTIDLHSGSATRVGSFGVGRSQRDSFIMSFAFDSDGNMYGASQTALYKIHPPPTTDAEDREARTEEAGQGTAALATKVVKFRGTSFVGPSAVMGIAFDEDGSFYAADFRPTSTIYAVNIKSGFLKRLFTSVALVHNIAFSPQGHHD